MGKYIRLLTEFSGAKRAVTAVEYGIMAALIATALVTSVGYVTGGLSSAFSKIQATMSKGTS